MKRLINLSLSILFLTVSAHTFAVDKILSLSNLERERAAMINDMLNPALDLENRLVLINKRQRQLMDMERMVIRDERLISSKNHLVKRAFDGYELTFLVHAGAENQKAANFQWLEKVRFSSASVMDASAGYR